MLSTSPHDTGILRRITYARSGDQKKETLNGIVVEPAGPGKVIVAATDGFLLAWGTLHLQDERAVLDQRLVIHGRLADAIGSMRNIANMSLEISPVRISIHKPGQPSLSMSPLNCTFPKWDKVIPLGTSLEPLVKCRFSTSVIERATKALGENFLERAVYSSRGAAIAESAGVFVQAMPIGFADGEESSLANGVRMALDQMPELSA